MKNKKRILVFSGILLLFIIIIIMPIIPIGYQCSFVDLETGNEISRSNYFMVSFNVVNNNTTLTSRWPSRPNANKPTLVLISKTIIYPFGGRMYIDNNVARVYYQLKNYYLEHPESSNDEKIVSFILYCKNNKLVYTDK